MSTILKNPRFKIIAAHCVGRGIGYKGRLPWDLSSDLLRFKHLTIGEGNNAIIMGRNTWESISKRPLPHRDNLILSRMMKGEKIFSSIKEIKNYCTWRRYDEVWIIGGEKVYNQFIMDPEVKNIYITNINKEIKCDTHFPPIPDWFKLKSVSSFGNEGDFFFNYELWKNEGKK